MKKIVEFTRGSGFEIPPQPREISFVEINFLAQMNIDELLELYGTVCSPAEAKMRLHGIISEAKDVPLTIYDDGYDGMPSADKIADQADALVDIKCYIDNAAVKAGINLDPIAEEVYDANLRKRGPDGEFHRDERGKVLKPKGWTPPDHRAQIVKQMINGSFTCYSKDKEDQTG